MQWCRKNGYPNFKGQRNYFEHIIRNEEDHFRIREYILNNPLQWELDEENPERKIRLNQYDPFDPCSINT
jgi:hypothetical protein